MRSLLFWSVLPWLIPQALWVRRTAPRFARADGPSSGEVGEGPKRRLLAIGDSIIAGVGASRLPSALVGQCATHLASSCKETLRWQAVGEIGITSKGLLDRLLPRAGADHAYIIVSVGVNDLTSLSRISPFRRRIHALLRALRRLSPNARIAVAGIPPLHGFPLLPQPLRALFGSRGRQFDRALRDVIAAHPDVVHVPLDFQPTPERFSADGFHPSESGYAEFGIAMANALMTRADQA